MDAISKAVSDYRAAVAPLAASSESNEPTFYPAHQTLFNALLHARDLPFEVRVNTSQKRAAGGVDQPDLAFYDGEGDFVVVLGEVKLPSADLAELALSTENDDQIGRYLARTRVVLLSNIRGFALLGVAPDWKEGSRVPPESRRVLESVELWSSASSLLQGKQVASGAADQLADLVETAVTEFAAIAEPASLARVLARQAKRAKAALPDKFSQAVQPLLDDFAKALGLHFEGAQGEEFLRSSLIQTAFYGLFAGWTLWKHDGSKGAYRWEDLGDYLKIPFLAGLFHEFRHPTRIRELNLASHLERAAATLLRVDGDRFFAHFVPPDVRSESAASWSIIYFYEPFLEAFDPQLRKELGVWYTPWEIVRYQVRKIDQILRRELGCARGFADDRVVVLDPCCGTGAYLIEVLRCISAQFEEEGAGAMLGAKLLDATCRRIIGFEILTAPYVVAQLQLWLILSELGVEPDPKHRPAIYLTNALTGWDGPEQLKLRFPELQEEHDAAQRVKREERIIIVLGNPPYNRFAGAPMDEEADLVDRYKGIHRNSDGKQVGPTDLYSRFGVRKQLLDDLYVRFFRLAEVRIGEHADYGVVSFISNSSWLTGLSHPLMRESLQSHFDEVWIDNLNGDKYRTGKLIPSGLPGAGSADQSVFTTEQDPRGIQVGTAIATLLKRAADTALPPAGAKVAIRDFWGRAALKRQALLTSLDLQEISEEERTALAMTPEGPRDYEVAMPSEDNRWRFTMMATSGGYEAWPALDELFPSRLQGVNPNRGLEGSVVDTDRERLVERMNDYFSDLPFETLAARYPVLCEPRARYTNPEAVRIALREVTAFRDERVVPYLVFPFDSRFIYYESEAKLLNERRQELWDQLPENRFLVAVPQSRRASEIRPLSASTLFDLHLHDRGSVGIPAKVRITPEDADLFTEGDQDERQDANLAPPAWESLRNAWALGGSLDGANAISMTISLIHFAIAMGHAPQFESDHQEALAQDWMHLPIPRSNEAFQRASILGETVAALLDPAQEATGPLKDLLGARRRRLAVVASRDSGMVRDDQIVISISHYGAAKGGWRPRAPRPSEDLPPEWGSSTGDLWLNDRTCLAHVPAAVWEYELGGYPVVKKWLGYRDEGRRPGRGLSLSELDWLREMIHRIAALLLLRPSLDGAYEESIADPFSAEELGLR